MRGRRIWRVDGLRIPVAGRWTVRVDILINDFEKIVLEDEIDAAAAAVTGAALTGR